MKCEFDTPEKPCLYSGVCTPDYCPLKGEKQDEKPEAEKE